MPRPLNGSVLKIDGVWVARIRVRQPNGKYKTYQRKARDKTHANALRQELLAEVKKAGTTRLDVERMTFAELADWYEQKFLGEPEYIGEIKVKGLRSATDRRYMLGRFREEFGCALIRALTWDDFAKYRQRITRTPQNPSGVAGSTVNRHMSVLRRMFRLAHRNGWIYQNPFNEGSSLIESAHEVERVRVLTKDEEARLFASCTGNQAYIADLVTIALDTGGRKNEILGLRWEHVDLVNGTVSYLSYKGSQGTRRKVGLTARAKAVLARLQEESGTSRVFPFTCFKESWRIVLKRAGLSDLRFHDLRHCFASRLIAAGMPIEQVSRLMGHKTLAMTYRYVNVHEDDAQRAARLLE